MEKKVKMTLVGVNANAMSLMAAFQKNALRQGWTQQEVNNVLAECKSGSYDHLVCTLLDHTEE